MNEVDEKRLINNLSPVKDEEKVIACLPEEFCLRLLAQNDAREALNALRKKMERMLNLLTAKQTIFWEDLKNLIEQADTAGSRGFAIGVRKDRDDRVVLVEFKEADEGKNPLLKLFGMGE